MTLCVHMHRKDAIVNPRQKLYVFKRILQHLLDLCLQHIHKIFQQLRMPYGGYTQGSVHLKTSLSCICEFSAISTSITEKTTHWIRTIFSQ